MEVIVRLGFSVDFISMTSSKVLVTKFIFKNFNFFISFANLKSAIHSISAIMVTVGYFL